MIKYIMMIIVNFLRPVVLFATEAPSCWSVPKVDNVVSENVLYLSIADPKIKSITTTAIDEDMIDLLEINNSRIKPLSIIDKKYQNTYEGFSKIRVGVYQKLIKMLEFLPKDIGIAYFEGLRPLSKQKEYFDKKFNEIRAEIKDKELAYQETSKHVSPFIDNIPTHCTGAAIDMTLFKINNHTNEHVLIDMGMFDTIHGHNSVQETFSENATEPQKEHRLILLNAAIRAGLVNYGFEWWHYSYGDKAWAYVKKKTALYGLAVKEGDPILSIDKETYLKSFK